MRQQQQQQQQQAIMHRYSHEEDDLRTGYVPNSAYQVHKHIFYLKNIIFFPLSRAVILVSSIALNSLGRMREYNFGLFTSLFFGRGGGGGVPD